MKINIFTKYNTINKFRPPLSKTKFNGVFFSCQNNPINKSANKDVFIPSKKELRFKGENQNFNSYESKLKFLKENEYIQRLFKKRAIEGYLLDEFANFDDEKFNQLVFLLQNELFHSLFDYEETTGAEIGDFAISEKDDFERLKTLLETPIFQQAIKKGTITRRNIRKCIGKDKEWFNRLDVILQVDFIGELHKNNKINFSSLVNLIEMDKESFEQLISLLQDTNIKQLINDNKITGENIGDFAQRINLTKKTTIPPWIQELIDTGQNEILKQLDVLWMYEDSDSHQKTSGQEYFEQLKMLLLDSTIQGFLKEDKIKGADIDSFAQLKKENFEQLQSLLKNNMFCNLLNKKLINGTEVCAYTELKKEDFIQLQSLLQISIIEKIAQKKLIVSPIEKLAQLEKGNFEQLLALLHDNIVQDFINKNKLDGYNIHFFAQLKKETFEQLQTLLHNDIVQDFINKNKFKANDIQTFAQLKKENFEQLLVLLHSNAICKLITQEKISTKSLSDFSKLGESEFNELKTILENDSAQKLRKDDIIAILKIYEYLDSQIDCDSIDLYTKFDIIGYIKNIKKLFKEDIFDEKIKEKIENLNYEILNSLKHTITPTQVNLTEIKNMMIGFFANNNPSLERLLSNTDFTQFKKEGLPLAYSRNRFLKDLSNTLKPLSQEEQDVITKKLEISLKKDEKGDIIGFDGIINLEKLENKGAEGKIKQLAYKFIKGNSIVTNNAELNKALNALIKGMPEFVNIIGKQQHDTHDLSLDIHILTVLENALKDEEYKNLSELDKTCLKFAIIMHDIAKSEGVIDDAHPEISALFARNILEKYQLPIEIKDRIFELIKYHHWLQDYNTQKTEANQMAALFRRKDDFSIAKIIAKADLKGVSDDFYNSHLEALNNDKLKPIEEALEKIYSTGQFIFTSKVIKKELIPQVEYKGYTYKVIDFTKINKDTDLAKYGFAPGTTSESLRLLVHMANTPRALEIVDCISDVAKESFLCTSYISLENCITYYGCPFGLSLEAENINIANAASENQASGCKKNFEQFKKMITINNFRELIPTAIKRILNLNESEYSKLYQLLASKKYLNQIRDDKIYKIGEKELSGNEIKKAIQAAQDELLIEQIEERNNNNEINLYNIKINALVARVKSIEEIPQEYLDFALIHDLPIYILGYDETI